VQKFLHGFTLECRTGRQFIPHLLGYIADCDLNAHACIMPALRSLCKRHEKPGVIDPFELELLGAALFLRIMLGAYRAAGIKLTR
jgi:hypothetical protein